MLRNYGYALANQGYLDRRKGTEPGARGARLSHLMSDASPRVLPAAAVAAQTDTHRMSDALPRADTHRMSSSPQSGSQTVGQSRSHSVEQSYPHSIGQSCSHSVGQSHSHSVGRQRDGYSLGRAGSSSRSRDEKGRRSVNVGRSEKERTRLRDPEREKQARGGRGGGSRIGGGGGGGGGRGLRQRDSGREKLRTPQGKVELFHFSGGMVGGSMIEAGRAGKQERERERQTKEGDERECKELSSTDSLDSRAERLGRYLSANLNFEPESDNESDDEAEGGRGLMLEISDNDSASIEEMPPLEGEKLSLFFPTYPATAATVLEPTPQARGQEEERCGNEGSSVASEGKRKCSLEQVLHGEGEDGQFDDSSDYCVDGFVQFGDTVARFDDRDGQHGNTVAPFDDRNGQFRDTVAPFDDRDGQYSDAVAPFDDRDGQFDDDKRKSKVNSAQDTAVSQPSHKSESGDDGWASDSGEMAALYQPSLALASEAVKLPPYAMYEDDVWVDEAKAVFAKHKKENSRELQQLLYEMFSIHTDVYSLLLAFVKRAGKTRHQPKSLPRITFAVFQKWLRNGEGDRDKKKEDDDQEDLQRNPAILRAEHQEQVLELMTRSHLVLLDDLCQIFQLQSANTDCQIDLVQNLMAADKKKEAVTYAWTFNIQAHFDIAEMVLPLIAMDKINLIESYIEEDQALQEEMVRLLDRLCQSGGSRLLASYLRRLGLEGSENDVNSKLSSKQLFKLALRLVKMYHLDLDQFPGLASQRMSMCLHHLLNKRYVEGSITDGNMQDLIAAAIRSRPGLQHQVIRELLHYGDAPAAAHWAVTCHVAPDTLPLSVQVLLMEGNPSSSQKAAVSTVHGRRRQERGRSPAEYLQLSLPLENVHFVDNERSLRECQHRLAQKGAIIGVDAEWRLPICNGGLERMALMQLAVSDAVYLLDMIALPQCLSNSALRAFVHDVFGNSSTIKLGYSIEGDLDLLIRSWSFAADILCSPVRVVDIKTLAAMVGSLQTRDQGPPPALPVHPLLRKFDGGPPNSPRPPSHSVPHNPRAKSSTSQDTQKKSRSTAPRDPQDVNFRDPLTLEGSLETRGSCRGLSLLVQRELRSPLDKSEQFSDWEKRPLRVEQVRYAALDAHCLLDLYAVLSARALVVDPHFNTEPSVPPLKICKSLLRRKCKEPTRKGKIQT